MQHEIVRRCSIPCLKRCQASSEILSIFTWIVEDETLINPAGRNPLSGAVVPFKRLIAQAN